MSIRAFAICVVVLAASRPSASDVPPAYTVAATLDETARVLARGREFVPAFGWPATWFEAPGCARPAPGTNGCAGLDLERCVRSLETLYDALRAAPAQPSRGRAVATRLLAEDVGAAIVRMQEAAGAARRGTCDLRDGGGGGTARVQLGPSPERLVVEPVLPLRVGTRYALVVEGLSAAERDYARARVVPRVDGAGVHVPSGAFVAPVMARQAALGVLDPTRTTALMDRLEREAAALPGWPASVGIAFALPAPPTGERLSVLHPRFVPADAAPAGAAIMTFGVLDVRAGLEAYRRALAPLPCADAAPEAVRDDPVLAGPFSHVAAVLRMRFDSLVVGAGTPATLGAPPDASRPVRRPLLVAVPRNVPPAAPVVLLVGGVKQSAAVMLASHADGLAARGMVPVALELPHQGALADGGEILTLLDPAALARSFRQGVVEALAAIGAIRRCGIPLLDGSRVRAAEFRYLGFSLGAMVGTLVRAVEPDLGAMVLLAAGSDHAAWQGIRVAQALGSPLLSCLGGPDDGNSCFERRTCASPGVCGPDPAMQALGTAMRLPYALGSAGGEPLAFAVESRTAPAPLLILTGSADNILPPNLAGRLADAYGLEPVGPGRRAAGAMLLVETSGVGHELSAIDSVRASAYTFLASRGAETPKVP